MKYWYQKPHPDLSEYIRTVLILEGFSHANSDTPLFTNGMPALIYRSERNENGNENVEELSLYGKSASLDSWSINENQTLIAYFFLPFSMSCVFNISASQLASTPIELTSWSPHKTNALKIQLSNAKNTQDKINALDNLLIQQLNQNRRACEIIRQATDLIMEDSRVEVLREVIKRFHLNERTFQRIFKKFVGLSANQYRRICQFQLSFTQLRSKDFEKLGDIAFDNGFADQSHFIRSFREFMTITPNDYLKSGLKGKK